MIPAFAGAAGARLSDSAQRGVSYPTGCPRCSSKNNSLQPATLAEELLLPSGTSRQLCIEENEK